MKENLFRGVGVALVTPFDKAKNVDFNALEKLVKHVIDEGVNYVVALGTTAETPTLSFEEKRDVFNCIVSATNKRVPIVIGLGGNNTSELINDFQKYDVEKANAILSVTPYYNKPTQKGLVAHYQTLNNHTPIPIILYNVPGRTGVNMSAQTTAEIAHTCSKVIAIKEASGQIPQCMELVNLVPKDFTVLSGDDNLAMAQIACGFQGVISVAANCYTKKFVDMITASLANNYTLARELHYQLLESMDLLFAEGNPAGVKYVLHRLGIIENELRLPLIPISHSLEEKFNSLL
ncbi:MAG: 4-hydroxy-tetrahydrodipicolinate synthase [Chitinophagaceae bacterium]